MEPWSETLFAEQLTTPKPKLPEGLRAWSVLPPAKRFAVYRNNVRGALTEALAVRYPVVQRLVGDDFFRAMASDFAIDNLPLSPVLIGYGGDFPDFIAGFAPAASLPYLPDVARLESAYWECYHAADFEPLPLSAFAAIDPAQLASTRLELIAACRIVNSAHPIVSIWQTNTADDVVRPIELGVAEDALVSRPQLSVELRKLPAGAAQFLQGLQQGMTLGEAAGSAMQGTPAFDLTQNLAGLMQARLVKGIMR